MTGLAGLTVFADSVMPDITLGVAMTGAGVTDDGGARWRAGAAALAGIIALAAALLKTRKAEGGL